MNSLYRPDILLQLKQPQAEDPIAVLVRHVFEPSTMAVVLRVSFEDKPPKANGQKGDVVILKPYDRRFTEDLRR